MVNKNKIAAFNIASTIILQGLTFFSGPVFSALLGTSNYGVASVYLTWVQVASTVFSLQAGSTIALARVNFPMEEQKKFQSSVLSLATIAYVSFSIITIFVTWLLSKVTSISLPMVVIGLLHGWGLYCVTFINTKFTYEFQASKNFVLSVLTSVLTIGISYLLIRQFPAENNYWGRIIGQSSVYTLLGFAIIFFVIRSGKTIFSKEYWRFTIPIALPTIFHLLANIVLNQSDRVMLQKMVDNSAAGIYALACTFGAVLSTVWSALNNSWVPFYYEYTRNQEIDEMKKHARNYMELFTVVAIGFVFLAREVFHLYARQSFWGGTDLIPLFSIGYYFVFLYSFPVNYEFYHKKTKTIAIGTGGAALCNIILNYFLIKVWGVQGAVIATAISHGLQFIFHHICAKRINRNAYPFRLKMFLPGFLGICAACVFYYFTRDLWWIRWGLAACLGGCELYRMIKRREIF